MTVGFVTIDVGTREPTCEAGILHVLDDTPEGLMARVATGDQRAFDALYDQLVPMVFGVVRRVLRDPAQSEEVTQEVFIEIWKHAGRFDGDRASARTWAVTIAHRRAVDRVRSEQAARDRTDRVGRLAARETGSPRRPTPCRNDSNNAERPPRWRH